MTAALAAAVAGAVAAAPAAAAEPSPPPAAHSAGLLDGLGTTLGGVLGGLLGTSQQQQLQQLLGQLQGGQAPTGTLLTPLQTLLGQVATSPGLPAGTQALVQQVAALLGSAPSGQPLDAAVLDPVVALLRQLAATSGVPASAAALLDQLADALDGSGDPTALPGVVLSLPTQLVGQLDALLRSLEQGGTPTGTLLQPVGELLDQVAGTAGLPPDVASLVSQLGDELAQTTGALDPLLTSQLSTILSMIANTPGVSPSTSQTIERIATILEQQPATGGSSGAKARTATKADRAVIRRIRVNAARTRIGVRVACPAGSPATCATTVRASLNGRKAASGKRVRIGAGRSKVVRLRLLPVPRAASVRSGGHLRIVVTTRFGARSYASAKTVRLKAQR